MRKRIEDIIGKVERIVENAIMGIWYDRYVKKEAMKKKSARDNPSQEYNPEKSSSYYKK